ncbi:MAG: glycosyltransferase [bacterium]
MKILHYIPTYAPAWKFGGPVQSVARLCESLAALGHEVHVFTSNAGLEQDASLPLDRPVERNGVFVTYFARERGMGIKCSGMEKAVREKIADYDVLHVTGVWQRTSPAACRAAYEQKIPYIVSPRGALGPYSWRQKTLKKLIYYFLVERDNLKKAAGLHYTSLMEKEECFKTWGNKPFCIIPNGLDFSQWRRDEAGRARWREKLGINEKERLFLNVGRLHHKKGLDLLPEALQGVKHFNWRMVFVGEDDDGTKGRLRSAFQKYGLAERLVFLRQISPDELPSIYSAADLFILPSRHENFGNVALEALACGCPVALSDQVGAGCELAVSGMAYILPRIAAEWIQLFEKILEEKQIYAGKDVREWLLQRFALDQNARDMAAFYQEILGTPL